MNNKEIISRGLFGNKLFGVSQILDTIQSRNSDFITSEIISNQWKADKNKSIEEQFFSFRFSVY